MAPGLSDGEISELDRFIRRDAEARSRPGLVVARRQRDSHARVGDGADDLSRVPEIHDASDHHLEPHRPISDSKSFRLHSEPSALGGDHQKTQELRDLRIRGPAKNIYDITVGAYFALDQNDESVREARRFVEIMRDEDRRLRELGKEIGKIIEQTYADRTVELSQWLVE